MSSLIDKLFPADSVSKVKKDMEKYARDNPNMSEAQIIEKFSGSMSRAKKAEAKEALKNMPLPKSKPTKEEREKLANSKSRGGMPKKVQMMRGGMANGKEHMYAAGGVVNDGLKALAKTRPDVVAKILK
jgi:SET domain-containing protein